jgi:hypothetical protein
MEISDTWNGSPDGCSVSSRGCNRAFIVCALYRLSNFVAAAVSRGDEVRFPIDTGVAAVFMKDPMLTLMVGLRNYRLHTGSCFIRCPARRYPVSIWWGCLKSFKSGYILD